MDNITHTLVGVLVGESAARATPARSGELDSTTRRDLFVTLMALGSNVPDLDFIPSRLTDSKLDYLLHHRGHTHTVLGALAIAALLYLACECWCRWKRRALSSRDRTQLFGIACLGTLLHLGLDYTNSYGVHPFWPLDNRWFYGDAVFIVEPLFWAACAPLVFILRSRLAKALVALALAFGVVLSFTTGMAPWPLGVGLVVLIAAMLALGRYASTRTALATSLSLWAIVNVTFFHASALARGRAAVIASQQFPETRHADAVLTPLPMNPLCWQVLFVQTNTDTLFVRRASLALAPRWMSAEQCPSRSDATDVTAPLVRVDARNSADVYWNGEIRTPRALLASWIDRDCHAAAFMRFARAPWLAQVGSKWVLGDARFDHERALSFAEIELHAARSSCPTKVPPWQEPREEW